MRKSAVCIPSVEEIALCMFWRKLAWHRSNLRTGRGTDTRLWHWRTHWDARRICRARNICHRTKMQQEMDHLNWVFQVNGFPEILVKKTLTSHPSFLPAASEPQQDNTPPRVYVHSCIKGQHQMIEKESGNSPFQPVFRPMKTLKRELMQVKNRTEVVYEVPCKDCPRFTVYGRNREALKVRLSEYRRAFTRRPQNWYCSSSSEEQPLCQLGRCRSTKMSQRILAEENCGSHSDQEIHPEHESRQRPSPPGGLELHPKPTQHTSHLAPPSKAFMPIHISYYRNTECLLMNSYAYLFMFHMYGKQCMPCYSFLATHYLPFTCRWHLKWSCVRFHRWRL